MLIITAAIGTLALAAAFSYADRLFHHAESNPQDCCGSWY